MTNERISLREAYDNRDVIIQLAILRDKLDSIPDADLMNVVLKTGDQIISGEKTFNDEIIANGGVNFANSGIHVNGTLEVDGDIIQNGSAYETHAEQVFSKNDLIVTREDAIGGIASGQLSGIRVKKYNGADDLNLGVDNLGVMRVGDLGDEQPLATRDEASAMTSGALVKWDSVNKKMIAPASNVGGNTKPLKEVGGELVPVDNDLVDVTSRQSMSGKDFTSRVNIIQGATQFIEPYFDVVQNHSGAAMGVYDQLDNTNEASLLLVYDHPNNKVRLILRKTVNGVPTYHVIFEV